VLYVITALCIPLSAGLYKVVFASLIVWYFKTKLARNGWHFLDLHFLSILSSCHGNSITYMYVRIASTNYLHKVVCNYYNCIVFDASIQRFISPLEHLASLA
jgi:hypothetical protein